MCKVDDLIAEYGLTAPGSDYDSVDDYLAKRWTGTDGRTSEGYKKLTDWFNKRVLKSIYEDHGRSTVSIHLDREYDVIVNKDNIQRAELAADLEGDGMDIDELKKTLVSHGTIRNHLKNCLEVEKDTQSTTNSTTTSREKAITSAKRMAASKTENILPELAKDGVVPFADQATVDVEIRLQCPKCDTRVPIEDAIKRGYVCNDHLTDPNNTDPPNNSTPDPPENTESDEEDSHHQSDTTMNSMPSSQTSLLLSLLALGVTSFSSQSPMLIDSMLNTT